MIPLFSTNQVREIDDYAINQLGIPGIVLMENAAINIFNHILQNVPQDKLNRIAILCGKGNNGGDGFAVARHLANKGFHVQVIYLGTKDELSEDSKRNFQALTNLSQNNSNIKLRKFNSSKELRFIADSDVIIDAMLGSGAKGELREPYKQIVEKVNQTDKYKIAIDIPTGLDAETGSTKIAFKADLTITLGELKRGLFYNEGSNYCGKILKGNIGVSESYFDKYEVSEYLIEPEDIHQNLPFKNQNIYKYSAGKVLTIAGSGNLPGAAALTSQAALKIGAGASILAFPKSVRSLIHNNIEEVVVNAYDDKGKEFLTSKNVAELNSRVKWADVLAIGPGLGRNEETIQAIVSIIKEFSTKKIVIDADAIFALSNDVYKNLKLRNCVFTPHHGEFANLIGVGIDKLKADILSFGRQFVEETGAYLVLKGAPTIIFSPSGDALINSAGNPGMAKFGTGDVLTGVLAGLISQQSDIEKAIINGVYLHSLAADLLLNDYTEFGFTATDIMNNLPKAIKFLRSTFDRVY